MLFEKWTGGRPPPLIGDMYFNYFYSFQIRNAAKNNKYNRNIKNKINKKNKNDRQ